MFTAEGGCCRGMRRSAECGFLPRNAAVVAECDGPRNAGFSPRNAVVAECDGPRNAEFCRGMRFICRGMRLSLIKVNNDYDDDYDDNDDNLVMMMP